MPKPAGPDFWQCTKISLISAGFCRIYCWNLRFFPGRGGATPGWRHPGVALARAALPRPLWKKTGHQHRIMQNRPFSCRFSRAAAVAAAHGATPGGASRGRQGEKKAQIPAGNPAESCRNHHYFCTLPKIRAGRLWASIQ